MNDKSSKSNTTTPENRADWPARLNSQVTADEQRILQILAIIRKPLNQTKVQKILQHLDWRTASGEELWRLVGKDLRDRLQSNDFITVDKADLVVHPELAERLARHARETGVFKVIDQTATQLFPAFEVTQRWNRDAEDEWRALRNAVYRGDAGKVLQLLDREQKEWSPQVDFSNPVYAEGGLTDRLLRLCLQPEEAVWFTQLDAAIVSRLLSLRLSQGSLFLADCEHALGAP